MPWLATARIRVGYSYDRLLYYATGGAGYVQFRSTATTDVVSSSTRTAWVVGVGQEFAVTRNVILRFELLYLQLLGNAETPDGVTPVASQRVYDFIGRIGLSYKFDWPVNQFNLVAELPSLFAIPQAFNQELQYAERYVGEFTASGSARVAAP